MTSRRLLLLCAGLLTLAGCDDDKGPIVAPDVPLAATRFVNVVPDTGATDWSYIDGVENSPREFGMAFRGFSPYQAVAPGERHLRVFPTSTNAALTSVPLVDQQLALTADQYYTIIYHGFARTGQTPADQLLVLQDARPDPGPNNIALRVVHLGAGLGNIDVYTGTTTTLPATPRFTNLAHGTATAYTTLPVGALVLTATTTGTTTTLGPARTAPAGSPASPVDNLTAVGGSNMGGSVITAIFVPRSVPSSSAPQTPTSGANAVNTPNWIFLIDRHPQ